MRLYQKFIEKSIVRPGFVANGLDNSPHDRSRLHSVLAHGTREEGASRMTISRLQHMLHRIILFSILYFAFCLPAVSQQSQDTVVVVNESAVILKVESIAQDLFKITGDLNRGIRFENIKAQFDEYYPEHQRYLQLGGDQLNSAGINRIQDLIIIMQRVEARLDGWQGEILEISTQLSTERWQLEVSLKSLDSLANSSELSSDRYKEHIADVRSQLIETRELIDSRKEEVLNLQIEIADQYVEVLKRLSNLKNFRANYWDYLVNPDTTEIIKSDTIFSPVGRIDSVSWRIFNFFTTNSFSTFLFFVIIFLISYLLRRLKKMDPERKFSELYEQRLAIALMLGLILFPLLFPPTTTLMYNFMLVISYIPFLVILRKPPFAEQFYWYLVYFGTYLTIRLSSYYIPVVSQFVVVIIYLGSALVFLAFLLNKRQYKAFNPKWKFATFLLWLLKFLLIAAFICYFTNRLLLAKIIIEGVGDTIALGMVLLYIAHWFDNLVDWMKDQPSLRHLHSAEMEMSWEKVKNFIRFVLILLYLIAFTHYFYISDSITDNVSEFLNKERSIGTLTFDFMGILLFLVVIYISSKIAAWIKFFTQGKSYYGSVKKTSTVATTLRFAVIMLGFLLALFLSGIPVDKITIILGALSVGLGFGLQNIVNNLVSGIILVFERPVQAGDFVEVKGYSGIVKEISIRASVVKTFDGAEVIIPNGHLISEEVINWTLSNQHRRVEVIVGVAYGTDVNKVKSLFEELVSDFSGVLKIPKPLVLFQEFGESSLNFSIRFWVSNIDDWLKIRSEMTTAIYHVLMNADIEIPFPQRDIHIKSMSAEEFRKISQGNDTKNNPQV